MAILLRPHLLDQIREALRVAVPNRVGKDFDQLLIAGYLGDDLGQSGDVVNGDGLAWRSAELKTLEDNLLAAEPKADELTIGDLEVGEETLKRLAIRGPESIHRAAEDAFVLGQQTHRVSSVS